MVEVGRDQEFILGTLASRWRYQIGCCISRLDIEFRREGLGGDKKFGSHFMWMVSNAMSLAAIHKAMSLCKAGFSQPTE